MPAIAASVYDVNKTLFFISLPPKKAPDYTSYNQG